MAKVIEYKGYRIGQTRNNHIWATKYGRVVLHAQCTKKLSEAELKATIDNLLKVCSEAHNSHRDGKHYGTKCNQLYIDDLTGGSSQEG